MATVVEHSMSRPAAGTSPPSHFLLWSRQFWLVDCRSFPIHTAFFQDDTDHIRHYCLNWISSQLHFLMNIQCNRAQSFINKSRFSSFLPVLPGLAKPFGRLLLFLGLCSTLHLNISLCSFPQQLHQVHGPGLPRHPVCLLSSRPWFYKLDIWTHLEVLGSLHVEI